MLAIRLSDTVEQRLANLAQETGRSKSYYARIAIEEFLQDQEDYFLALSRLEKQNPKVSLEELEKRLGLDS